MIIELRTTQIHPLLIPKGMFITLSEATCTAMFKQVQAVDLGGNLNSCTGTFILPQHWKGEEGENQIAFPPSFHNQNVATLARFSVI